MSRVRSASRAWSLAAAAIMVAIMVAWIPTFALDARDIDRGPSESGCPDVGGNLVRNGSFEEPAQRGVDYGVVLPGQRIGSWLVSGDAVDHIAPRFWEAAHGGQSLDLNHCGPASVSQRVPTAPGDSYELCFGLAGNPGGPPEVKRLEVIWGGSVVGTLEFDAGSTTMERMGWTYHRLVLRASQHDAVLSFHSLTPGCYGPVIDRVTLHRLPDPVVLR